MHRKHLFIFLMLSYLFTFSFAFADVTPSVEDVDTPLSQVVKIDSTYRIGIYDHTIYYLSPETFYSALYSFDLQTRETTLVIPGAITAFYMVDDLCYYAIDVGRKSQIYSYNLTTSQTLLLVANITAELVCPSG